MNATAPAQKPASFYDLLSASGYAPHAIKMVMLTPLMGPTALISAVKERFTHLFDNYYMQFLALQLERYHFDLNRPFLPAPELQLAGSIIGGKHGNPPLDSEHVAALLNETCDVLVEKHLKQPLSWNDFFAFTHRSADGSIIRGQDIILGLIKTDSAHHGAFIENYHHRFQGHVYGTYAMMQVMADALETLNPSGLTNINRFGRPVNQDDIESGLLLEEDLRIMNDPRVKHFVTAGAHERMRQGLDAIFDNLKSTQDLTLLHQQRIQLLNDYFDPASYPKPWRIYMHSVDNALQLIATPYA